jgi:hypothetical protein
MKNATACPFFGGGTPGLLSIEGKSSNAHLLRMRLQNVDIAKMQAFNPNHALLFQSLQTL